MGSWCADNLRNIQAWKDEKLEITVNSNEAAKLFDATLRQVISWIDCEKLGGIKQCLSKMFDTEPDFFMGKVLKLGLDALGTTRSINVDENFSLELKDLCSVKKCNLRERRHALAVNYFANDEIQSACSEWEKILAEHPNDLLALKFAHDAYFFIGDKLAKRDSIEKVIDKWSPNAPCYSYIHGMYAFGLEECGNYDLAFKHAKIALNLNKYDCWATHAISHCYEMRSDYINGIKFLESTIDDWSQCSMLACHNFWHNSIFYLETNDFESALSIYDNEIQKRAKNSKMMLDVVDAASLLTRVELIGGKPGIKRWLSLLPLVEKHVNDHVLAFNDAHISMILANCKDKNINSENHLESINRYISKKKGGDNWRITRDIGELLCEAIVDYNANRFDRAFEKLYPIRFIIYRIGGSNAQRDVFTQILAYCALNSSNMLHNKLAVEIIEERSNIKTNSNLKLKIVQSHIKAN